MMYKIPSAFQYSDNDRTLRYKDNGCDYTVTAPEGFIIRFYSHDSDNFFWYLADEYKPSK